LNPKVTVVDYGIGNLLSVERALEHCGAEVCVAESPQLIANSERLLLPGVGAFGNGMDELTQRGLVDPIREYAASGRPLLGICLGMQLLFDGSDEFGASKGLGLIRGWVRKLPELAGIKLPHVGWSPVSQVTGLAWAGTLLEAMNDGENMYFVHSYHSVPQERREWLACTHYGDFEFCSVVRSANVSGCQFHPEKSGEAGLQIIRSFLHI